MQLEHIDRDGKPLPDVTSVPDHVPATFAASQKERS